MAHLSTTLVLLLALAACSGPSPDDHGQHVLRVAGVFPTPIEEPWPQVVDRAFREEAESHSIEYRAEYGVGDEHFEDALRRAAGGGNDIVVADTFGAEDAARRIAVEHPSTHFFFGSSLGPTKPNVSVFDSWLHEAAYLAGMAAGFASRTHRIGVVAAMPGAETNRVLNGFRTGALESDPSSCLAVLYTETWFDEDKAAEAGRQLIAQGADVLYAERLGAERAAAEAAVPVIGNFQDQQAKAPDVTLTSVVWSLRPAVAHLVSQVEHRRYHDDALTNEAPPETEPGRSEDYGAWSSLVAGGSSLAPWLDIDGRFGPEPQRRVEERRQAILSGILRVPVVELPVPECAAP